MPKDTAVDSGYNKEAADKLRERVKELSKKKTIGPSFGLGSGH